MIFLKTSNALLYYYFYPIIYPGSLHFYLTSRLTKGLLKGFSSFVCLTSNLENIEQFQIEERYIEVKIILIKHLFLT